MSPAAPTPSVQMDTFLALCRAYVALTSQANEILKPYDLSVSQYNVLRIIRTNGGVLPSGEIAARLVWPSSDLTRLLDGLERKGFIARERSTADRRVVHIHLTNEAAKLLRAIDHPIEKLHAEQLRVLSAKQHNELRSILDALGGFLEPPTIKPRPATKPTRRR